MWLITNLTTRAQTARDFYFQFIRINPFRIAFLTVSIDNEKKIFFFYYSRHVRSRHIVYGQDT